MGLCQSHTARRKGGDHFYLDGGAIPFANRNHRDAKAVKSTPSGGKTSSAYDLVLISPSERTDVTDVISPTSMYSPTLINISPIKKESHFDFVMEVNENGNFQSHEGLEDLRSRIVMDSDPDHECAGIGVEKRESFNDEDCQGLDSHGFTDLSTTREDEFAERDQSIQDGINGQYKLPHLITTKNVETTYLENTDNYSRHLSIAPITNKRLIGKLTQSNREANEEFISSKLENAFLDRFESYKMNSKLDSPPLLAPPDDIPIATHPSNTYTAVNPAIVATFNKMKTHVKELQKQEKQRRQEEKIKDRRQDIEGYKELWGEYNKIQKRVVKQHSKNVESTSPNKEGEKISLTDSNTWFVDFSALKSENYFNSTGSVNGRETTDNDRQKNQTNLPFLIESSAFYSKQNAFGQEGLRKVTTLCANMPASDMTYASSFSQFESCASTTAFRNDHQSNSSESDKNNNIPVTMDFDLGTRSVVSELENRSNSSMASEIDRAFDNDDYGVLRRYSRKLVESTVPTHTENFNNAQLSNQDSNDVNGLLLAPKSLEKNGTTPSFSNYLAKNCLPSVSIENAETGLIRWRESPKNDVEFEEASKMD